MKKSQLDQAVKVAQDQSQSLLNEDITIFNGFALTGFKTVVCTIRQLAALVRWQAVQLNGSIEGTALNEIANIGRHKFNVVGE